MSDSTIGPELGQTADQSPEEFYQLIKYVQGLLYKAKRREDGHFVITVIEGQLLEHLTAYFPHMIGKTLYELFPKKAAELEKLFLEAASGKSVQFEWTLGNRVFCNTLSAIHGNRQETEVIGSVIDISELKQMQNERINLIEDFKKTLQILPNAVFKCYRSAEGKFYLTLNEGALAVESNLTTEQVIGKSIDELFDPVNAAIINRSYERAFTGETVEFLTEKNGRYFHNYVMPVFEEEADGTQRFAVKELVGFHSEVTEKKRTEEKLQEIVRAVSSHTGEAYFRTLVEQLAHIMKVESVILGRTSAGQPDVIQTVEVYSSGDFRENFSYKLSDLLDDDRMIANGIIEGNDLSRHMFAGTPLADREPGWHMAFPLLQTDQHLAGMLLIVNAHQPDPLTMQIIRSIGKVFVSRTIAELERKQAEEELVVTNTLLKATQESLLDGILIVDSHRKIIGHNRRFAEMWQLPDELLSGREEPEALRFVLDIVEHGELFYQWVERVYADPDRVAREEVLLKNGRVIDMYTQPAVAKDGIPFSRIWYFRDITEQKRNEEQIKHQAYFDVLTGLPNRMLFHDRLSQAISQANRNGEKLAVLFLNLDRFKIINETLSHFIGDALLKEVSQRLAACLHAGDTLSRLGSDEFKIILPEISQGEDAAKVAQQILDVLSQPFVLEGHDLHITASIGITLFPDDGTDNKELVFNANAAMSRAKANGGNQYSLYSPALISTALEKLSLESELRKAVERGELVLHYQPRINLATNKIIGMEALVRWQHPQKGRISPAAFIPLAEETDLIVHIDRYVLRSACKQAKAWQDAGFPPLRVAVNISARHFQRSNLIETVASILAETGLSGQYLELEITEGTTMSDAETAISLIRQLKTLGIHIAIDDFGTGYSSLSYLKKFPIDTLKIDQSFIRDISVDLNHASIVSYIISLGHSLHLNVIAEGVETEEQRAFLQAGHCNEMQGYLFSPPVPPEEFECLLMKDNQA
ncbi:EAL domain-containing protein [Brevibacillus fluminis]|uniref:sensor domain-containing protein n=1 Tax=Brevibacillus fluminis TaxID=511487 RepID=UPI003F88E9AD